MKLDQIKPITYRSFRLNEQFLDRYKGKQPEWGPVGYITYKRTYARRLDELDPNSPTEEWWQTIQRVVEGTFSIQKNHCSLNSLPWSEEKAHRTAERMYKAMWEFKFLPPGRGLWSMGTNHIDKVGGCALNNCAFVSTENIDKNFTKPFTFLMDVSMLGVGVGFDTLGAGKVKIRDLRYTKPDLAYTIPDSREGWVKALELLLAPYVKNTYVFEFDFSKLRKKGEPIKGFGGHASGPEPLIALFSEIREVLDNRADNYITSSDIVDIQNLIGKCVVAGNVRRSAELAIGQVDDTEFILLKNDHAKLMNHRWASNNSISVTIGGQNYDSFAANTAMNGEPGYVWLDTMRKYGRLKDPPNYLDHKVMGANPCVEQTLESFELCCLVETFVSRHESLQEYFDTLKLAYLYAKTVTLVPIHIPETDEVVKRNRRIGCSQSGITNAFVMFGRRKILEWCDKSYVFIDALDKQYSSWLRVPESIKKTSIKPSGTVSLLPPNINPGIHYGMAKYYIRRMRIATGNPLLKALESCGYHIEQDQYSKDTSVVSFPVHDDTFIRGEKDVSMWEQLENAAQYQYYWADNSVSVTIKFQPDEAKDIVNALTLYESRLKAVSFLPYSADYPQMPIEPIDEQLYSSMKSKINEDKLYKILSVSNLDSDGGKTLFCDSDKCEIRKN